MTLYSYSRINCFLNCPAQFQHRYILRTPQPVPEGIELFMGSRFHEAMEFLYKIDRPPGLPPALKEVLDDFNQGWEKALAANVAKQKTRGFDAPMRITREGLSIDDYRRKAEGFVENYYRRYHPFNWDRTEAIEMKVVFKLDSAGKYMMNGYIDRVAMDAEGTLWVHDYKTGARKMTQEEADEEDQLALYMLGLRQIEKYREMPIRLQWHFVAFEEDEVVSERKPDDLKALRNRYVHHIKQIESAKEYNTHTTALCGWCEFLTLCKDGQAAVALRARRAEERAAVPVPQAEVNSTPPKATEKVEAPPPPTSQGSPERGAALSTPVVEDEPPRRPGKKGTDSGQMSLFG